MPVFIKQRTDQVERKDGTFDVQRRDWTEEELAQIRKELPSRFITVPESHAADVIRPQGRYQEIEDVPQPVAAPAEPVVEGTTKPVQKKQRTKRTSTRKVSNGDSKGG